MLSRRTFLQTAALYTAGFAGLRALANQPLAAYLASSTATGYGPLLVDPAGFRYTAFSRTGETMDDGLLVPGPDGRTLLVRNHELESAWTAKSPYGPNNERFDKIDRSKLYDAGHGRLPNIGGTTTLVFNTQLQKPEGHFLSLAGTVRNCAGGPTPWGTWITCEEVNLLPEPDAEKLHGYNFEVTPSATPGLVDPVPLKAMGRFRHEAVAIDPTSGAVYQTEDLGDGLLYRFLPKTPGKLSDGGRLQALVVAGQKTADTRNWTADTTFPVGQPAPVTWIDLADMDSPANDLRQRGAAAGAAVFARGEGAWWGNDSACFAMTNGGRAQLGQVFRYRPSPFEGTPRENGQPATLELFCEPNDKALLSNCDNVVVAPWGDLILCEDTKPACRLIGVTPSGRLYVIAANVEIGRELAGACFSPDGTTLFVNVQDPGYTLAITGPWDQRRI